MTSTQLQLLHMLPDPQRLTAWAGRHRLLDASGDLGYAFHGLLRAGFGERAPRVFRYLDSQQGLLAYSGLTASELHQTLALAPPEIALILGLGLDQRQGGLRIRPFPTEWRDGQVLGFEVKVRPVIRESKTGKERDAFLVAVEKQPDATLERVDVYRNWLANQFARNGAAQLLDCALEQFRLLDVLRRTQSSSEGQIRRPHRVNGPDAVLSGQLRVQESAAFAQMLARGVGRHRAFGYGFLMLRPSRR